MEETTPTIEKTSFLVEALSLNKKLNLKFLGCCKFFAIKSNTKFYGKQNLFTTPWFWFLKTWKFHIDKHKILLNVWMVNHNEHETTQIPFYTRLRLVMINLLLLESKLHLNLTLFFQIFLSYGLHNAWYIIMLWRLQVIDSKFFVFFLFLFQIFLSLLRFEFRFCFKIFWGFLESFVFLSLSKSQSVLCLFFIFSFLKSFIFFSLFSTFFLNLNFFYLFMFLVSFFLFVFLFLF